MTHLLDLEGGMHVRFERSEVIAREFSCIPLVWKLETEQDLIAVVQVVADLGLTMVEGRRCGS